MQYISVWFVHGIIKTSLEIFTKSASDVKTGDEEDPNLSKTNVNGNSGSADKTSASLMLYSRLDSTAKSSGSGTDVEEDSSATSELEQTTLNASKPTQRRYSLDGINEEEEIGSSSKEPTNNSSSIAGPASPRVSFSEQSTPATTTSRLHLKNSNEMLASQKSRFFNANEVMHMMGFDDENTGKKEN